MKRQLMTAPALVGAVALAVVLATTLGASPAPTATVHIKNFAFAPESVTVRAGQSVRFVNDDQDAHTVTGKGFDSGGLDTGDAWTHTFAKPGTYAYICALHPYMRGTIVVKAEVPHAAQ